MDSENLFGDLNNTLIQLIVTAHKSNNFRALESLGLTHEQVDRVARMSIYQIQQFNQLRSAIADISFDSRRFDICINYIQNESDIDTVKDHMIQMDASSAMLLELAGMDIQEYRGRRRRMSLDKPFQGRPGLLNPDEAKRVNTSWLGHRDETNELLHYHKVGVDTGLPLNKIWAHMRLDQ
jgi:hypothetical protein